MDRRNREAFLLLARLGIGTSNPLDVSGADAIITKDLNWSQLKALANEQGLLDVMVDGIDRLTVCDRPPKELLLQWIGQVMQDESRYAVQRKAAEEMASLFNGNYIRTYVLKGEVVSECYPNPKRRVSSDLDCFLLPKQGDFDAWDLGNNLIGSKKFKIATDFYKNSTFYLPGLTVENHRYMVPFRGNKKLKNLEMFLQGMMRDDNGEDRFEGTWLYRPPVMVSSLFLIEHAYSHFLHEGLTWRMVLDWMLFREKHRKEICWSDLDVLIDEFGFRKFYDSFYQLGKYLIGEQSFDSLEEKERRMLDDIWAPLDLHESLHGVKAKFQLAGNYWRARWKYKYFTEMTWIRALLEWVFGAVFDRHPKLD